MKPDRIRDLNDTFRSTFTGGRIAMTAGVAALPEALTAHVLQRVRSFEQFDSDNDPHGEHDFGAFEVDGDRYFWKIDYYAPDMDGLGRSERPRRVLTVMLADEY